MDCNEFGERLSAYLENELSVAEQDSVRDHLGACTACRRLAESAELFRSQLSDLEEEVPFFLRNRLLYVPEPFQEPRLRLRFRLFPKWAAAAVGTLVLVFSLFYFTDIYPAANRWTHYRTADIGKWISRSEGLLAKVKDSRNFLFFSFFQREPQAVAAWQLHNPERKWRSDASRGGNG